MFSSEVLNVPTQQSPDGDWENWWNVLSSEFGKKDAQSLWLKAWATRGSSGANTTALRGFMAKQGVTVDAGNIFGSVADSAEGVLDSISSIFSIGKTFTIIIGGVIVLGAAGLIITVIRKPGEVLGVAARAAV